MATCQIKITVNTFAKIANETKIKSCTRIKIKQVFFKPITLQPMAQKRDDTMIRFIRGPLGWNHQLLYCCSALKCHSKGATLPPFLS